MFGRKRWHIVQSHIKNWLLPFEKRVGECVEVTNGLISK